MDQPTDKSIMKITFRDKDHFYKIIRWLNSNVGKGKENWTIHGKVLKHLTGYSPKVVTRNVQITNTNVNLDIEETQLYLTLI